MARGVVALRPLLLEQCLGLAVTLLLPPVHAKRVAAMMPVHSAGVESDAPPARLQSPAEIHVVAGCTVAGIKAADSGECLAAKRHVASRDVLGLHVSQQDVHGPSR